MNDTQSVIITLKNGEHVTGQLHTVHLWHPGPDESFERVFGYEIANIEVQAEEAEGVSPRDYPGPPCSNMSSEGDWCGWCPQCSDAAKWAALKVEAEPEGDWPSFDDISAVGLTSGMGPGPMGYWRWEDVYHAEAVLASTERGVFNNLTAITAAMECEQHKPDPEDGSMCPNCDTGFCTDCNRIVYAETNSGWYRHATRAEVGCFLIEAEGAGESEGPYHDTQQSIEKFRAAFADFYKAGQRLVEAWDDGGNFNADEFFPLPEKLRPPMSMDEWLTALDEHYRGFAQQDLKEAQA